jgi:hypothetical protein
MIAVLNNITNLALHKNWQFDDQVMIIHWLQNEKNLLYAVC